MLEPAWWKHIIACDTLRAGVILAALFAAAWAVRRWKRGPWRVEFRWRGEFSWRGVWFYASRVSGPWPHHVCIGPLSIDVLRRNDQ